MKKSTLLVAVLMALVSLCLVFASCDSGSSDSDAPTPPTTVAVESINLNETELVLGIGTYGTLTATVLPEDATDKSVTWSSSDETVATVDQEGNVHAVASGTATITVKTVDGEKTDTCEVTVLPAGALAGVFTVDTSGKKVHFSQGNLQATYNGTNYSWGFAENQYDYIGNAAGNTSIDSQTDGAVVDLFGWSTYATLNNWGIHTKTSPTPDYTDGNFKDWGKNAITNGGNTADTWRTLSNEEWSYLLNTRDNASNLKKCGVTVCTKTNCLIIAPDNFSGTIETSYDATAWSEAEAEGLVCLPAAGYRSDSVVNYVGSNGYYWSATPNGGNYAYFLNVGSSNANVSNNDRHGCQSVRLVCGE